MWLSLIVGLAIIFAAGCARTGAKETEAPTLEAATQEPSLPPLRIEPAVSNVTAGQRTWAQIRLSKGHEITGTAFEITFDPRYVRVEDSAPDAAGIQIRVDSLCDSPLNVRQEVATNEVDNEGGVIRFESTWSLAAYLCEDALIASVELRGVTEGGSPLRFESAKLTGPAGDVRDMGRPGNALVLVAVNEDERPADAELESPEEPSAGEPADEDIRLEGAVYHVVREGETLSGIAAQHGTTVAAIVRANGLQDPNALGVGQRLLIPTGSAPVEEPENAPEAGETATDEEGLYVIQPGDTLYSIAAEFDTTVEALAELNGLEAPYTIRAGDTLRVRPAP